MNTIKSIVKNIIIISGFSAVTVFAWTGPTAPPPGNNTSAPINVSSAFQSKAGSLWIDGGLGVGGGATIGTNGGNVGIGATAPSNKLEVLKASTPCCGSGSSYGLRVNYGGATYTGVHIGDFGYGNAGVIQTFNQPISINPAGNNVGIGTQNPISVLDAYGTLSVGNVTTAGTVGKVQITTAGASPISNRLTFGTDGSGWKFAIGKNQVGTVSDLMTIQDNGNVGVGITNPTQKLEVVGNIKATGAIETGNRIQTPAGSDLLFEPAGAERMRIVNDTGSVGIGTAYPGGNMLDIASGKGGVGNSAIRALYPGGAGLLNTEFGALAHRDGVWTAVYGKQGAANSAGYFDGSVGIGVATPAQKLDVAGYVKGTGLCIGSDCRTSWPGAGGGGNVSGSGTSGTLPIWTGANSIGNYSGAGCPAGQVMVGLNANGTPNCVVAHSGSGTSGTLTNWTGANSIGNYSGASCPAGQVMSGLNANGTLNCVTQSTVNYQKVCIGGADYPAAGDEVVIPINVPPAFTKTACRNMMIGLVPTWTGIAAEWQLGCVFDDGGSSFTNAVIIDPNNINLSSPSRNCGW